MFCCEVEFDRQAGVQRGQNITIARHRLQGQAQHTRYELAVQRIRNWRGDEVASDFMARVQRTSDRKDARAAAAPKVNVPIADRWREALQVRQAIQPELKSKQQLEYTKQVAADRRLVRRKIFAPEKQSASVHQWKPKFRKLLQ